MEALALLCTLHADGPATLRRLRRAGCETLEALDAYEPDALADLLHLTPAAARRFEREARMLCARLTTGILDREEVPESARAASVGESAYVGDTGTLQRRDREILGKVLERWGHDDVPAQTSAPEAEAAEAEAAEAEPAGIEPGLLDGLDARLCAELSSMGVNDLESLVEAAPLELAGALGEGFAQVRRWQFLARRVVATAPESWPEPAPIFDAPAPEPPQLDLTPHATPAPPITVRKPWPVQAVPEGETSEPGTLSEPAPVRSAVAEPAAAEPAAAEPAAAEPAAAEPARALAWVPRKFWEAPRTGEPIESTDPPPQAAPPRSSETRTTLNWNFEIPPPPPLPPLATPPEEIEQAGGPFA